VGLAKYRDQPIELLTLSACETAEGDDRAALGLAGLAIQAGARSALGTLWQVNDGATSVLIQDFYHQLQDASVSRARALQKAQQRLLAGETRHYTHPAYWSAFLLISSWL
jgi:CHAT domain-containing protein